VLLPLRTTPSVAEHKTLSISWSYYRALHDLYAELQRIWPQVEEYYTQMPTYQMEREFYAELVQIKIKAEEYLRRTKQEQ